MLNMNKANTPTGFEKLTLLVSIIAGIIGLVISGIVYGTLKEILWSPLAVGLSFALFTLVFILCMAVFKAYQGSTKSGSSRGAEKILLPILFVVGAFILGTLFEFIYERDFFSEMKGYQEPTSYIFLIDNSGSMNTNDPQAIRYDAIEKIVSKQADDFPYAVYGFSNGTWVQRELAPAYEGVGALDRSAGGGTEIKGALETFYSEYENGLKDRLGSAPKVLLLSDGVATDIGIFSSIDTILDKYSKADLPVSTVGLGSSVDEELMQQIADETGGVFISSADIDNLEEAMQNAISSYSDDRYARTLYTHRRVPSLNILYALMRIVFMGVLSVGISLSMLVVAADTSKDEDLVLKSSLITGVLAGLIMELAINMLNLPPSIIRIVFFILTAVTFVNESTAGGSGKGSNVEGLKDDDKYTVKGTTGTSVLWDNEYGSINSGGHTDTNDDWESY